MYKPVSNFTLASLLATSCAIYAPAPAFASSIGVQPLIVHVSPGQSAAVRVNNGSDTQTTVETFFAERIIDEAGLQIRQPADDDFIIFPPQAAIAPQGTQVFRLQPIMANVTTSRSYFFTVQQVPVAFAPTERDVGGAQIQVVFAFDVAVHVVPRGAEPDMEFVSITSGDARVTIPPPPEALADLENPPKPTVKTVPGAVIAINNNGNRYLYLQNYDYEISAELEDGTTTKLPPLTDREIIDAAGVTLVLPGSSRTFTLPLSMPLPEGSVIRSLSVEVRERGGL